MVLLKLRKKTNKSAFIFVRTQGGGVKKLYRFLDFSGVLHTFLPSIFLSYLYDPCRNAHLALFVFINGILSYRIGTSNLDLFSLLIPVSEDLNNFRFGNVSSLSLLKGGTSVHTIPLLKSGIGTLARAAGLYAYLFRTDFQKRLSYIRIRRGLTLIFDYNTLVTIGRVCNSFFGDFVRGKAGVARLLNRRPIVRGIAMNPVDHPNGGRTPGGKIYRSFSNKIARSSKRTRKISRFFNRYIQVYS